MKCATRINGLVEVDYNDTVHGIMGGAKRLA